MCVHPAPSSHLREHFYSWCVYIQIRSKRWRASQGSPFSCASCKTHLVSCPTPDDDALPRHANPAAHKRQTPNPFTPSRLLQPVRKTTARVSKILNSAPSDDAADNPIAVLSGPPATPNVSLVNMQSQCMVYDE